MGNHQRKQKKDGYSSSMIAKVRGILHQALRSAEANKLIQKNPVPLIEKMRRDPPKKKEAFTAEKVRLLMEHLPQTLVYGNEKPSYKLLCELRGSEKHENH